MLTADLVRAYKRGGELRITALSGADRDKAVALAERYLVIFKGHVGDTRAALDETLDAIRVPARERKIAGGLRKLLVDRCHFEAPGEHDPAAVRAAVFARASQARKDGAEAGHTGFERERVLVETARELGLAPAIEPDADADAEADTLLAARVEHMMYTDLKGSHQLLAFDALPAAALVDDYQDGQAQAVLLRARWVRAQVVQATPSEYRALFRKLKFLRLLHDIRPLDEGGYEIAIDGPYSMFRSVTKYGLSLALILPILRTCQRWSLDAEIEWGRRREPLRFHTDSSATAARAQPPTSSPAQSGDEPASPRLPDEVADLLRKFQARAADDKTPWRAEPATELLSLPGVGVCAPDLVFSHRDTGECVYLEVMGFWSRDAVWRRVELVEAGLSERVIFALSTRLRVSEAALADDLPGALYVYKGAMSPRAIEERLDRLAPCPDAS